MIWLKLVSLAIQLVMYLLSWAEKRKAIAEGEANAIKEVMEKSDELINIAQRARDSVSNEPSSVLGDEFNRDNAGPDRREPEKDGL